MLRILPGTEPQVYIFPYHSTAFSPSPLPVLSGVCFYNQSYFDSYFMNNLCFAPISYNQRVFSICLSVCLCQRRDWYCARPAESIEMKHGVKILWDTSVPYTYSMVAFADCHNSAKNYWSEQVAPRSKRRVILYKRICGAIYYIVQELCESRGGRPRLSVLTSLLVSVDVKNYWTVFRH